MNPKSEKSKNSQNIRTFKTTDTKFQNSTQNRESHQSETIPRNYDRKSDLHLSSQKSKIGKCKDIGNGFKARIKFFRRKDLKIKLPQSQTLIDSESNLKIQQNFMIEKTLNPKSNSIFKDDTLTKVSLGKRNFDLFEEKRELKLQKKKSVETFPPNREKLSLTKFKNNQHLKQSQKKIFRPKTNIDSFSNSNFSLLKDNDSYFSRIWSQLTADDGNLWDLAVKKENKQSVTINQISEISLSASDISDLSKISG